MSNKPAQEAADALDDPKVLRAMIQRQATQLAMLMEATGGVTILPPEERPVYEIGEGNYYSPDDVYYPAGAQIEDINGTIIPNESMIPLNAAAEARMMSYLRALPSQGTPNFEHIMEAAMLESPERSDDPQARAQYFARVFEKAIVLKMQAEGRLPTDKPEARLPVKMPQRQGNVPMMSNTRIRDTSGPGVRDQVAGPAPTRGPRRTQQRQAPVAPADKPTPAMGTVQSLPLGTEPDGVTANRSQA